jgi:arylsulfatase A-like enzyme
MPVLQGSERPEPEFYISGWTDKFRMFRQKEWKIVKLNDENWELYNLENDPTEINNLSILMPEKVKEMEIAYQQKQTELREAAK